jgi:phage tail-like protein
LQTSPIAVEQRVATSRLRLRLAREHPPPVVSARETLRTSMPQIYRDREAHVVQIWLDALETVLDPIVGTLDVLPSYFHPSLSPRDVLELTAAWLGIAADEAWPDRRLRDVLGKSSELARRRGTKRGLQLALGISFPQLLLRIEDHGAVTWGDKPPASTAPTPAFDVYCDVPIAEAQQASISRVINQMKPVHASYRLRVKTPRGGGTS